MAHRAPPDVQQLFVRAAGPQFDFDPEQMKDDGLVATITPRTHGKIRAPLRDVESAVESLIVPHSGLPLVQSPLCYPKEKA